jgi:hypothetical protein
MEEYFEYFLKRMGPSAHRREVPFSTRDKYKDKLPPLLISHWEKYGWSGYGDGIFWTVNPAEYDVFISDWLADSGINQHDQFHVIAKSAFGDLYLWQEKTGSRLTICSVYARYLHRKTSSAPINPDISVQSFFASKKPENNDLEGLFHGALKTLGPLQPDEMYGFVPALALGGPADLKHLQKVKTIEHLTFLSQLAPLTDWGFPDLDSL